MSRAEHVELILLSVNCGVLPTKVLAKAGRTEAVVQPLQHCWALVRAGQATFDSMVIINFYFYFHLQFAGMYGIPCPSLRPIPVRCAKPIRHQLYSNTSGLYFYNGFATQLTFQRGQPFLYLYISLVRS
jgi:hypothetical protein